MRDLILSIIKRTNCLIFYSFPLQVIKAIKGANIRHKEDIMDIVDEQGGERPPAEQIKLRASSSHKGPYDFETVKHLQVCYGFLYFCIILASF